MLHVSVLTTLCHTSNLSTMAVTTWREVRVAMTNAEVTRVSVAQEMGYRRDEFARLTNSRDSYPTEEWLERFQRALEAVSGRKVA